MSGSFDVEAFARQTIGAIELGDEFAGALELRVTRLEEIVAARWPRGMFLRRRLARELRASADLPHLPPDFVTRRIEAVGNQLLHEAAERSRRRS